MKKGYTLLETIIVLGLISIVSSVGFIGINFYNNKLEKINQKSINANIVTFINDAKLYCKTNKQIGTVTIEKNIVILRANSDAKMKYILPQGYNFSGKIITLTIEDDGTSVLGETITIINRKGKKYEFTLSVQTTVIKEK